MEEGGERQARMRGKQKTEVFRLLDDYWLEGQGLHVKLERGFAPQDRQEPKAAYWVHVEYDELADRIENESAARQQAEQYCTLLKAQLETATGYSPGKTEDDACLSFPVIPDVGRYDDAAMKRTFQLAKMRAWRLWDPEDKGRGNQRAAFRHRLAGLLATPPYAHLAEVTRKRLLEDVPATAFPAAGKGR
jgi:hypothetical protein